jgi:hypothetical protein
MKKSRLRIRVVYSVSELFHPGPDTFFPSRIPDPNFSFSDPDPEVKKTLDSESGSATLEKILEGDGKQSCTVDLDEEMLEGDGLVCVVVHVGVPKVGEYSQLSRHCIITEKSINRLQREL